MLSRPGLIGLSRAALGDDMIAERLPGELFPEADRFAPLVARWEARPAGTTESAWLRELRVDPTLRPLMDDLVLSLLFGVPYTAGAAGRAAAPGSYFEGRFWAYVRAHPLGLSGGYFGHWSYPPEVG